MTVTWNVVSERYEISITDVNYMVWNYITVVTPAGDSARIARVSSGGGNLIIYLHDLAGNKVQQSFQFVTYEIP